MQSIINECQLLEHALLQLVFKNAVQFNTSSFLLLISWTLLPLSHIPQSSGIHHTHSRTAFSRSLFCFPPIYFAFQFHHNINLSTV